MSRREMMGRAMRRDLETGSPSDTLETVFPAPAHAAPDPPRVELRGLRALWFQITGTLCNLACRHCFNSSGPKEPWLRSLPASVVRRYIAEADALGVKEFYFTGGEPLLHPEILPLLADALAVAPTTLLTNGTLVDAEMADRLVDLAARSPYSFEVRVSVDAPSARENDAIRGRGSFAKARRAVQLLASRGLYPIVTATEILGTPSGTSLYDRLRAMLVEAGVARPRIKLLPVLPLGRVARSGPARLLTESDLATIDPDRLQCSEVRVVAEGGIYACPILAGLPGARLATEGLAEALGPAALYHPTCVTCYETGLACRNF